MEIIDPLTDFTERKKAADEARAVLVAERTKLKAEDKARRAELKTKIAAIDKLLGRPRAENGDGAKRTRKPKPDAAPEAGKKNA